VNAFVWLKRICTAWQELAGLPDEVADRVPRRRRDGLLVGAEALVLPIRDHHEPPPLTAVPFTNHTTTSPITMLRRKMSLMPSLSKSPV
jgi:hypothetical protein